jgi:hypothetical protein
MTDQLTPSNIAVIDSGKTPTSLTLYTIPFEWTEEEIIDWLLTKGHRMSEICWGEFGGEVQDKRFKP